MRGERLNELKPAGDVASSVSRLYSRDSKTRRAARRTLRAAPADAVLPLLDLVNREAARRRRRRPLRIALAIGALFVYAWWLVHLGSPVHWNLILVFLPLVIAIVGLAAVRPAEREAAQVLATLDDPRAVGALAEALEFEEWQLSGTDATAARALIRLLPKLEPEHAALLDAHQRSCLYRALGASMPGQPALALAVMSGLTNIGDTAAIPHIERLAHAPPHSETQRILQKAADSCLRALMARRDSETAPRVLLRAAIDENSADTLLHPAVSPETAPETLLRSSDNYR